MSPIYHTAVKGLPFCVLFICATNFAGKVTRATIDLDKWVVGTIGLIVIGISGGQLLITRRIRRTWTDTTQQVEKLQTLSLNTEKELKGLQQQVSDLAKTKGQR